MFLQTDVGALLGALLCCLYAPWTPGRMHHILHGMHAWLKQGSQVSVDTAAESQTSCTISGTFAGQRFCEQCAGRLCKDNSRHSTQPGVWSCFQRLVQQIVLFQPMSFCRTTLIRCRPSAHMHMGTWNLWCASLQHLWDPSRLTLCMLDPWDADNRPWLWLCVGHYPCRDIRTSRQCHSACICYRGSGGPIHTRIPKTSGTVRQPHRGCQSQMGYMCQKPQKNRTFAAAQSWAAIGSWDIKENSISELQLC